MLLPDIMLEERVGFSGRLRILAVALNRPESFSKYGLLQVSLFLFVGTNRKLGYNRYLQAATHIHEKCMRKEWTKEYPGGKGCYIRELYFHIFFVTAINSEGKFPLRGSLSNSMLLGLFPSKKKNKNSSFIVQIRQLSSKCWNFGFLFQCLPMLIFHHYFPK